MFKKVFQDLSERYRKGITPYLRTPEDRQAYLLIRFPATKAALARVFQEIKTFSIESILDIGAGPGTSWFAAKDFWGSLQLTYVEPDPEFFKIGREKVPQAKWVKDLKEVKGHDLVVFSYSWGEIDDLSVLEKAWALAEKFLIVVEPGTPRGYEKMLKARDYCISQGAKVYAPCPHSRTCPWQHTKEWCHFSVRLERSAEHRLAKEASLGYEDEKFSYVILSKEGLSQNIERLVKDPSHRKGHVVLTLCTQRGIETKIFSKKNGEFYKTAKKLKWGDAISEN